MELKNRQKQNALRAERRAAGLCPHCGEPGRPLCERHRQENAAAQRRFRAGRPNLRLKREGIMPDPDSATGRLNVK
jgi:hypothetical protein